MLRIAVAAVVSMISVGAPSTVLAQYDEGTVVTVGGGTSDVAEGDVVLVAPGVTISGGVVANETGIGVVVTGGSSVGAGTGGGENASVVE